MKNTRTARTLTPAEQQAQWLEEYMKKNGDTPGRAGTPQAPAKPKKGPKAGSKGDLVLEAARGLPRPFTEQELVVAAWRLRPEDFSLDGFCLAYPDRHIVRCCLFGERGLFSRGLLKKRDDGLLEVAP